MDSSCNLEDENSSFESQLLENIVSSHIEGSFVEDDCIIGHFDDATTFTTILEKMRNKGYTYSVRDSDMRTKSHDIKNGAEESCADVSETKKCVKTGLGRNTIFYQLKAMSIKFFGMPFIVDRTIHYQCVFGLKYYKSRTKSEKCSSSSFPLPMKKRRNVISKKMGCRARMTLKKIVVYPEYTLGVETDWRKKKKTIECLRNDLSDANKKVQHFYRYYLSVSLQSSHNHPPMPPTAGLYTNDRTRKGFRSTVKRPTIKPESKEEEETLLDEKWEGYPSGSLMEEEQTVVPISIAEPKTIVLQDTNFLSSFVKLPDNFETVELKPTTINVAVMDPNFEQSEEPRMYQIQTIQYSPTPQVLQSMFRDKLKRLFTLSQNCFNSPLLLRLISDLEAMEVSIENSSSYETVVE